MISTTNPNFNPFLSNTPLANEFILLISHSYNEKEADNVLRQKKENHRWLEECSRNNMDNISVNFGAIYNSTIFSKAYNLSLVVFMFYITTPSDKSRSLSLLLYYHTLRQIYCRVKI